jgi:hypothetical protein
VSLEGSAWKKGSRVLVLVHAPDVDIALFAVSAISQEPEPAFPYTVVAGSKKRAITSHTDTCSCHVVFGNQLVRASILAEVPDSNIATSICADQFTLVGMDDNIVDRMRMRVVALLSA